MFFLFSATMYCQNKNVVSLGMNIVDDSFTSNSNPFNVSEEWNVGNFPSYFNYSGELLDRTYIEFNVSTNEYKKGKLVNGSFILKEMKYFAIDFTVKYKLLNPDYNFLSSNVFDPFLTIGLGETKIDKFNFYTINYGCGFYFWFPKSKYCNCASNSNQGGNFGLIITTLGKSSMDQAAYGNQIQHSFGLAFRF